jgi:hypothetical protein
MARPEPGNDSDDPAEFGHPRGTLVIVAIFGALFAAGWIGMYVFSFFQHGAPH